MFYLGCKNALKVGATISRQHKTDYVYEKLQKSKKKKVKISFFFDIMKTVLHWSNLLWMTGPVRGSGRHEESLSWKLLWCCVQSGHHSPHQGQTRLIQTILRKLHVLSNDSCKLLKLDIVSLEIYVIFSQSFIFVRNWQIPSILWSYFRNALSLGVASWSQTTHVVPMNTRNSSKLTWSNEATICCLQKNMER